MNSSVTQCPEPQVLLDLVGDSLDESQTGRVEDHLSECVTCQKRIESLSANRALWEATQEMLNGASVSSIQNQIAIDQDQLQRILGPTDDPEMLGRIGSYEVSGIIGAGGTGIVFKAFDSKLNRFVAIKVLAPNLARSSSARARFEREGQAIAAVSHDHVVPVYAVDDFQGLPYLVMQYVPGQSLQQRIHENGPLNTKQIVRIALQVAQALGCAHAQGIIHRDVKPANVLLANGIEQVRVTDFGLAQVADDASMTRSGVIAGTPQYMSPEQATGETLDGRSDLFCLGSVMYTMCVGHPPFRSESIMGTLHRIANQRPRSIRSMVPDIPTWLESLIFRLLEKSPEDRFDDASSVASVLEMELARLQHPSTGGRERRAWLAHSSFSWPRINRAIWPIGLVVATLIFLASPLSPFGFFAQTPSQQATEETDQLSSTDSDSPHLTEPLGAANNASAGADRARGTAEPNENATTGHRPRNEIKTLQQESSDVFTQSVASLPASNDSRATWYEPIPYPHLEFPYTIDSSAINTQRWGLELAADPSVQNDLQISETTGNLINAVWYVTTEKERLGKYSSSNDESRKKLWNDATAEWSHLLSDDQMDQIWGLVVRQQGVSAFVYPSMQHDLSLQEDQISRISDTIERMRASTRRNRGQFERVRRLHRFDADQEKQNRIVGELARQTAYRDHVILKQAWVEIHDILTPEQRAEFDSMRGPTPASLALRFPDGFEAFWPLATHQVKTYSWSSETPNLAHEFSPPTRAEILSAWNTERERNGLVPVDPSIVSTARTVLTKFADYSDSPKFYPAVGVAQLRHVHYRAQITLADRREFCVYLDRTHLLCQTDGRIDEFDSPLSSPVVSLNNITWSKTPKGNLLVEFDVQNNSHRDVKDLEVLLSFDTEVVLFGTQSGVDNPISRMPTHSVIKKLSTIRAGRDAALGIQFNLAEPEGGGHMEPSTLIEIQVKVGGKPVVNSTFQIGPANQRHLAADHKMASDSTPSVPADAGVGIQPISSVPGGWKDNGAAAIPAKVGSPRQSYLTHLQLRLKPLQTEQLKLQRDLVDLTLALTAAQSTAQQSDDPEKQKLLDTRQKEVVQSIQHHISERQAELNPIEEKISYLQKLIRVQSSLPGGTIIRVEGRKFFVRADQAGALATGSRVRVIRGAETIGELRVVGSDGNTVTAELLASNSPRQPAQGDRVEWNSHVDVDRLNGNGLEREPGSPIYDANLKRFKFQLERVVIDDVTESAAEFIVRYQESGGPNLEAVWGDPLTNSMVIIGPPDADQAIRKTLAGWEAKTVGVIPVDEKTSADDR